MQKVADSAGVSRVTAYKHFRNRDHLLAEVVVAWSREVLDALARQPPIVGDPATRIAGRFGFVYGYLLRQPRLLEAVLATSTSPAPAAVSATAMLARIVSDYIGADNLADFRKDERDCLIRSIGYLFYAQLLAVATGRATQPAAVSELRWALERLLRAPPEGGTQT